jgi:hypothetical protein
MGQKLGIFSTNRKQALNGYISFITASIYWCAERLCGDTARTQKKIAKYKCWIIHAPNSVRIAWWRKGLSFRQYIDTGMLFPWTVNAHRISCAWSGETKPHSVRQYIDGTITSCIIMRYKKHHTGIITIAAAVYGRAVWTSRVYVFLFTVECF